MEIEELIVTILHLLSEVHFLALYSRYGLICAFNANLSNYSLFLRHNTCDLGINVPFHVHQVMALLHIQLINEVFSRLKNQRSSHVSKIIFGTFYFVWSTE